MPHRLSDSAIEYGDSEVKERLQQLCKDCRKLSIAILTGDTASAKQWQTLQSANTTLTYLRNHLDTSVESLKRSADAGCRFCDLLIGQLRKASGFNLGATYHIFVWGTLPAKEDLKVAIGDVDRFTKHISEWKQPQSLAIYTRQKLRTQPLDAGSPYPNSPTSGALRLLPGLDLECEMAFEQARKWTSECRKHHEECRGYRSKLPKRVLDLGESHDLSQIKLYLTKSENIPYATLSYSWGQAKRLLTRKENLKHRCQGIPINEFPRTLRDAVYIAKMLGFRYLWIDSLCIIQGDKNDWVEQGAAMTEIYSLSTLNISASSSRNSNEGILKPLQDHGVQIGMSNQSDRNQRTPAFVGPPIEILDLEEKLVSTRGWVFQERLVSPATLHYTDEGMLWECVRGIKLGHYQNVFSTKWKAHWKTTINTQEPTSMTAIKSSEGLGDICESWNEWICAYSERDLFDCRDKFPAIAGVAKTFANAFKLSYAAGLWKENLISGLLWRRHNRKPSLIRFEKYVAPSWSWASVHGRLEYSNVNFIESKNGPTLKILNIEVSEEHPGTFGRVRYGQVVAEGLLQEVIVDRSIHPGVRKRSFQECGIHRGFVNKVNIHCMLDVLDESAEPLYPCWCLRVGSCDSCGRDNDLFLLLEEDENCANHFRRVGFAETDPWENVSSPVVDSGLFDSPKLAKLTLI